MALRSAPHVPLAGGSTHLGDPVRLVAVLTLVLGLVAYAYSPLLASGLLGEDYAALLSVEDATSGSFPSSLYEPDATEGRPLATLSLLLSRALWSDGGLWTSSEALALRLENLLLALLAAWGLHGLMRRAITPWLGIDPAKAAAHTGAALFLLHPVLVVSIGRVASRGDLLALALGAWACRIFLVTRQERRVDGVPLAAAATLACSFSSELVLMLPPLLAGLEYISARRHRPRSRRARTALATFAGFGALVSLEWLGRLSWAGDGARAWLPGERALGTFPLALEKLGVVLLPVDSHGLGAAGYLVAALGVLIALHPGFVAARSAPRLWGRILLGWGISLTATAVPHLGIRVPPGTLQHGEVLLAAGLVMAVGFGISATALSGWRRTVVPVLTGAIFSILGRAVSLPREEASQVVLAMQEDLLDAARQQGWSTTLVVLDPPQTVAGVDALGGGLAALVSAPFLPGSAPRGPGPEAALDLEVVGASRAALAAWRREREFTELRSRGAVLLVSDSDLGGVGPDGSLAPGRRVVIPLAPPGDGASKGTWRGAGRTPSDLVLDPLEACFFQVVALPEARTDEPPVIRWSSATELGAAVPESGAWIPVGHAPEAHFDLEDDVAWLAGGTVRSVWFPGDLTSIVSARASAGPQPLTGDLFPRPAAGDWLFDAAGEPELVAPSTWRLTLLDLGSLEVLELLPDPESAPGRLQFVGADSWSRARIREGAGPVAWTLDRRVEDVTVARARGRVADTEGSLPVRED